MKVDIITNYDSLYKQHHSDSKFSEKQHVCSSMYESANKNVNRGYNSGSSVSFGAAANVSKGMRTLKNINLLCQEHKVIAQNLVALVLATVLRPAAIISLPGKKNKDDKIYASGHSMASGLIGFCFSSIVMYPLGIAAKKYMKEAEEIKNILQESIDKKEFKNFTKEELLKGKKFVGEKFLEIFGEFKDGKLIKVNRKALEMTTGILEMAPDVFVFGVLKAMLTVALIPPILKYVFGVEKNKGQKPEVSKVETTQNSASVNAPILQKPNIAKFLGGVK